jgi:uncharacterized membrane protein YagU involved in acid resistance
MLTLGAIFHYLMTFTFALLFFLLVPRHLLAPGRLWIVGAAYGLCVWTVMNGVVLPLSALATRGPDPSSPHTYIGILVVVLCVGLPITIGAARHWGGVAWRDR